MGGAQAWKTDEMTRVFSPLTVGAATSAWIAAAANLPLWRELHSLGLLHGAAGWGLATALFLLTAAALTAILCLFAWRWTLKPIASLLLAVSAASAYFMWTYRVVIDSEMLVNVLQTDAREVGALVSARMLMPLLLFAASFAIIVWVPVRTDTPARQARRNALGFLACLLVIVGVTLAAFQSLAPAMRSHKQLRYLMTPLNSIYAAGKLLARSSARNSSQLLAIGVDAVARPAAPQPPLLVLVVGETARSASFGMNGYERPTTPALSREQAIFTDVSACGTSTAVSLPCMFSHLGRPGFLSSTANYENLLDVLQRAGFAVMWLDNQSGCKGICSRVPHENTVPGSHPAFCSTDECLDGVLLPMLQDRLEKLDPARRARGTVVVLHQMGSHGPGYHRRSPGSAKRFVPECATNNLQNCSREEVRNAYDNSILYTDEFLGSVIEWLEAKQSAFSTAMLYVSDHGESLGEHGLYLHGLPYAIAPDVQKQVPWISWFSPTFSSWAGLNIECVRSRSRVAASHDNYFHSVLGLMHVRTSAYSPAMDLYRPCSAGYSALK